MSVEDLLHLLEGGVVDERFVAPVVDDQTLEKTINLAMGLESFSANDVAENLGLTAQARTTAYCNLSASEH